jgi:hypothetical protein
LARLAFQASFGPVAPPKTASFAALLHAAALVGKTDNFPASYCFIWIIDWF